MIEDSRIAETLLNLARGAEAEFCPSDAARALSPADWPSLVGRVRKVAGRLQRDGLIHVTQSGRAVDALRAKGPIRLSRPLH
ncbi:MAG: hypothetical protein ACJAVR_002373 [Paracoccaceae bacterium]|jgi:hypothetical protein